MNYRIVSLVLAMLLLACTPAVFHFSWTVLNTQTGNLQSSTHWVAWHFEDLTRIRKANDFFTLDIYTGMNGCVRIKFTAKDEQAQRVLTEILALHRDAPLLVEWPDHTNKFFKPGRSD